MKLFSRARREAWYIARRIRRGLGRMLPRLLGLTIVPCDAPPPSGFERLPAGREAVVAARPPFTPADTWPRTITERIGTWNVRGAWVLELRSATIVGPAPAVRSGRLLFVEAFGPGVVAKGNLPIRTLLRARAPRPARCAGTLVALASRFGANYFHWLTEVLPLVRVVRPDMTVLVPKSMSAWQRDSLLLAGVESTQLVEWDGRPMRGDVVNLPSFAAPPTTDGRFHLLSPDALGWVRSTLTARVAVREGTSGERIYVSRTRARTRRVINEAEILPILESHGFRSWHLEDLSFEEQVSLFSRASVVVGPHGAGLTNAMFSTDAVVLELGPVTRTPVFYELCSAMGHAYGYIEGALSGARDDPDVTIPGAQLDSVLSALPLV